MFPSLYQEEELLETLINGENNNLNLSNNLTLVYGAFLASLP